MKVAEWGNSLAIRLPRKVVAASGLTKGEDIEVRVRPDGVIEISRDDRRERAMRRIRELARPLPEDWKFDRDEVHTW